VKNRPEKLNQQTVTIVGAGIVGMCCAWQLNKRGFDVTVIDSSNPGIRTSFGNAGCISPSHILPFSHPDIIKEIPQWLLQKESPLIIRWRHALTMWPWLKHFLRSGSPENIPAITHAIHALMVEVHSDWSELIEDTHLGHFVSKQGVLKLFSSPKRLKYHFDALRIAQEYGYEWQEIKGKKLKELEPNLKVTDSMRAAYFPSWQHILDPEQIIQELSVLLLKRKIKILKDKVVAITPQNEQSFSIHLQQNESFETSHCVVAAGVWSNHFAQQLDFSVPLIPKRGYHVVLNDSDIKLKQPLLPMDDYFLMTPMLKGLRIAGMAEFDQLDAVPNYQRADLLLKRSKKYLSNLPTDSVTQWMGQRPMLPDSLPIISRSPSHANLYYAFGHGHYGLTQGPTTGKIIADMVSKESNKDLHAYRFNRFQ